VARSGRALGGGIELGVAGGTADAYRLWEILVDSFLVRADMLPVGGVLDVYKAIPWRCAVAAPLSVGLAASYYIVYVCARRRLLTFPRAA
jgi:hypothetical protein